MVYKTQTDDVDNKKDTVNNGLKGREFSLTGAKLKRTC
jgi:hypothetical protein